MKLGETSQYSVILRFRTDTSYLNPLNQGHPVDFDLDFSRKFDCSIQMSTTLDCPLMITSMSEFSL